ncbi:TldD/PmbA family protein [Xenococcus sp. PCC 7305]|uniref:TldD/PmbA family protein n=1 Tax=Xenococcus sp. PCC 7305 TaxID=102125 RepID=UPI000594EC86|nr:TldD/PmbA family protein [Xenococcus sp. PCC 7305]
MNLAVASTILGQEEAVDILESVIEKSQADDVFVSLSSQESALSRFSENQISQNIQKNKFSLTITSYFGKRSASASTTELDPDAIAQTLRRCEDLARFAPEDPEWVELLAPQTYEERQPAFDLATADLTPLTRGEIVQEVCQLSVKAGVAGSGTFSTNVALQAIANSAGLRGCDRNTRADFSFTARQDNGSSWSQLTAWGVEQLPILDATEKVIQKAILSRNPQEVAPGDYTVIFEPNAMAGLLPWVIWNMDARAADEGRSFMSCTDEAGQPMGNRVGEELFSPLVQIQRNPTHPLLQSGRFFGNGLGNSYLEIVRDGSPQALSYSCYWAQQKGKEANGSFFPIVMAGSEKTVDDLIAGTEKGILVTRAWYVRYVNPRTLEVTGMTRDGTFWIEEGKIAYPIKNLRFNQSLPAMLKNIEAVGMTKRCGTSVIPACKVNNFHFSSITDSI